MTPDRFLLAGALVSGMLALIAVAVAMIWRQAAAQELRLRVQAVTGNAQAPAVGVRPAQRGGAASVLARVGEQIRTRSSIYSADDIAALEAVLAGAGFKSRTLLPIVLGGKVVFFALTVFSAVMSGTVAHLPLIQRAMLIGISLTVGLMVPELVLRMLRGPYVNALRRGVADALDLLVVCTQAGMGLDSALKEVSREMQYSNPQIASALTTFLDELKILPDRRQAFQNFGRRSGVEGIRRMATILGQTLQYGTPLGQALRAMANELRREQMIRLEARAVRLPALLVFPLIAFILPSLFIALMGPTLLRLFDMIHGSINRFGGMS
jgi:tight adherence protein C